MKSAYLFTLPAIFMAINAHAAPSTQHLYANGITSHNIAAMQHSIMLNAIDSFEGSIAPVLGAYAKLSQKQTTNKPKHTRKSKDDLAKLYGSMPLYGTMPLYGEYEEDNTTLYGRNGGDSHQIPVLNDIWLNWRHFDDDAKFNHFAKIDSDYDLISAGISGARAQWKNAWTGWGAFAGYVGSDQKHQKFTIDGNGGYVGLYGFYKLYGLNIAGTATAGALYNDAETDFGNDEYTNAWIGGGINASYDIILDQSFVLQPGVFAGYTWIKSGNYTSYSGADIQNSNFNIIEITPSIRAIKHIANGWFGTIGARYVFTFAHGGDASANNIPMQELKINNYSEYGIGIEKAINRFNISLNLGRRDGGRTGWNGGIGMRYWF